MYSYFEYESTESDKYRNHLKKGFFGYQFHIRKQVKSQEKTVYNVLDFLGDVGGLVDGLKYLAQFLLGVIGLFWN